MTIRKTAVLTLILLALALAACAQGDEPGPGTLQPAAAETGVTSSASTGTVTPVPTGTQPAGGETLPAHFATLQPEVLKTGATQSPPAAGQSEIGPEAPAVQAAIKRLSEMLSLAPADITVVNVTQEQWPDSCLGLPSRDEMCLMVITPGYRVVLSAAGQEYEFHTDRTGRLLRLRQFP